MRAYKVVDVFTTKPLIGNPVAVVLDAEGLDEMRMQAIARWTNLSETTFVLPATIPDAQYQLRIFTPGGELPFAGHPTLGSAHALLEAGRVTAKDGVLRQECRVGVVRLVVAGEGENRRLTLDLPPAKVTPLTPQQVDELDAVLGAPVMRDAQPAIVDVGATWVIARFVDAAAVTALTPDFARCDAFERALGVTGVTVFGAHPAGGPADIEVRSFCPSSGMPEDPVCGSGNGAVAVFMALRGLLPKGGGAYRATQGCCIHREGHIALTVDAAGGVTVGGAAVTTVDGVLDI